MKLPKKISFLVNHIYNGHAIFTCVVGTIKQSNHHDQGLDLSEENLTLLVPMSFKMFTGKYDITFLVH